MNFICLQGVLINLNNIVTVQKSKDGKAMYLKELGSGESIRVLYDSPEDRETDYLRIAKMSILNFDSPN